SVVFTKGQASGDLYILVTRTVPAVGDEPATLLLHRQAGQPSSLPAIPVQVGELVQSDGTSEVGVPRYTFEVTEAGPLFFEWRSSSSVRVTWSGPSISRNDYIEPSYRYSAYASSPMMIDWAFPGQYTLTLSQSGFDYDFVVHTLSDAKPMPADGVVDTAFAASEYIDMWQLDAQAGSTYLLQPEGSGSNGSYYAVYDQSGSRLASGALSNTWSSTIYASQNGPLTVVVFRGYPGY